MPLGTAGRNSKWFTETTKKYIVKTTCYCEYIVQKKDLVFRRTDRL